MSAINPKISGTEQDEIEVYKKEMAESKEKFECYELLKKLVDEDKQLKNNEIIDLEDYLRTIRLTPANKFHHLSPIETEDLTAEISFMANWNKFVWSQAAETVDDKICCILAEVIFKAENFQANKGKKIISESIRLKAVSALLLNATWNIDNESEDAMIIFIKVALDQLEEEFHGSLIQALQPFITNPSVTTILCHFLHMQYFQPEESLSSFIGAPEARLKAIQVLSASTALNEKIVNLFIKILEVSDIIKNEYFGRSRSQQDHTIQELNFHHKREDIIVAALIAGLNFIVSKQVISGEMDKKIKESLEKCSDSVKLKFITHNPLLSKPDILKLVTPKILPVQAQPKTETPVKTDKPKPLPLVQPALPIFPAPVILSQQSHSALLAQTAPAQAPGAQTTNETQTANAPAISDPQPAQPTRPFRVGLGGQHFIRD